MTDPIERRLRDAFDARTRSAVGDSAVPPVPRFAESAPHRRRVRLLAPLAAAAAVVAVVGSVLAVEGHSGSRAPGPVAGGQRTTTEQRTATDQPTATDRLPTVGPLASTLDGPPAGLVHVTGAPVDGANVGVGMPIVVTFGTKITDARPFVRATRVTVNGVPADGAWYFEESGNGLEAHYREKTFWPAHAKIHVEFTLKGVSAGNGLSYDGRLVSLDFTTGPQQIATVSDQRHRMTVTRDGKSIGSYPVSLGAPNTPTTRGTKVIMAKGGGLCMSGPGYSECGVQYAQRLTSSGEYLHAAPWNIRNIDRGIDSSNGCTNLLPTDAAVLYKQLRVGDVVKYPDASGPPIQAADGFGDWNVPWSTWLTGGVLPTR